MERIAYFLGANTPGGFFSFYDQLWNPATASAVYLLKGGPGCGKSTLMRRIAARAEGAGERTEYILCSGDPSSLDAVILPERGVVIADATAPHGLEPVYAGVVEHYVNLGDCYDKGGLGALRERVIAATGAYRASYEAAPLALAAAEAVGTQGRALLTTPVLREKLVRRARGILGRECKKTGRVGTVTRRFLSGTTCDGSLCLWGTAAALCPRIYELADSYALAGPLLETVLEGAVASGYDAVACHCPTAPGRLEHLLLPGLGLGFLSSAPQLPYPGETYRRIRVDAMADPAALREHKGQLRFVRKISGALMEDAVAALGTAKGLHDQLEALYRPHTDFARADCITEGLCREIFG
ncbi:MAG: hypothetical protein RR216_06930 [Pseudoflavonifractor sp.]